MKIRKVLSLTACSVLASGYLFAGTSNMDFPAVYEKECQGCHGPIHQGGVGSDLRPDALKKKERHVLRDAIMNGVPNTAMPQWQHMFSKDDADGMVDWLMDWKDNTNFKLNLEERKLKNKKSFEKKLKFFFPLSRK